jgi:hypothetical protein
VCPGVSRQPAIPSGPGGGFLIKPTTPSIEGSMGIYALYFVHIEQPLRRTGRRQFIEAAPYSSMCTDTA